jgi:hypothetical protein
MALVRMAIKRGWPVSNAVKKQIVAGLCRTVSGQSARHVTAAARLLVMLDEHRPAKRRRGRSA